MVDVFFKALVNAFKAPPAPKAVAAPVSSKHLNDDDGSNLLLLQAFPSDSKLVPMQINSLLHDPFSPDPFRAL